MGLGEGKPSPSFPMAKVIKAYPPNYTWLKGIFPIQGRPGIIYAYGDRIYNPSGSRLGQQVIAHEEEHCRRQMEMGGPGQWWDAYVANAKFRLAEEVLAHRIEWNTYVSLVTSLKDQNKYLDMMVKRLSGPLYGKLVSEAQARELIEKCNE